MDSSVVNDSKCPMCESGKITPSCRQAYTGRFGKDCSFCGGSGEPNSAATFLLKNHICQCTTHDRKNCPVCGTKCHHDTPNRPKILIAPM